MEQRSFLALGPNGFHRLAYTEWGDRRNPHTVICVHGLTRNSRDFDALARALEGDFRVICLDVAGRGKSEWLTEAAHYGYPLYVSDAAALVARVSGSPPSLWRRFLAFLAGRDPQPKVDWVGTSMGGLIGMMLAARKNSPIRRLVLNDVGPVIPRDALNRIGRYVGQDPRFDSLEAFEAYLREIHAPFGPLSDAQWRHLALHSHRRTEDGRYAPHYDPAIGETFRQPFLKDLTLWDVWDAVRCPVLVLRGAQSDLLTLETVRQMQARGPGARYVEFAGIGHAPALMSEEQIRPIRDFLRERTP